MPKRGPCGHCGTNCTPLWRNGPKEKPVLCNACGSRWRLSGNLHNYVPHNGARTRPRARSCTKKPKKMKKKNTIITRNISKIRNGLRSRTENSIVESSLADPYYYYYSTDDSEFEVSNNSSTTSDSATSYCKISTRSTTSQIPPGRDKSRLLINGSDNNDGGQCSRARTPVSVSAVDKLQKDLYNIMVRLGSSFKSPDEDLLLYNLNYNNQIGHEIGLGGVLLQPPPSPPKGPFTVCNNAAPMGSSL